MNVLDVASQRLPATDERKKRCDVRFLAAAFTSRASHEKKTIFPYLDPQEVKVLAKRTFFT